MSNIFYLTGGGGKTFGLERIFGIIRVRHENPANWYAVRLHATTNVADPSPRLCLCPTSYSAKFLWGGSTRSPHVTSDPLPPPTPRNISFVVFIEEVLADPKGHFSISWATQKTPTTWRPRLLLSGYGRALPSFTRPQSPHRRQTSFLVGEPLPLMYLRPIRATTGAQRGKPPPSQEDHRLRRQAALSRAHGAYVCAKQPRRALHRSFWRLRRRRRKNHRGAGPLLARSRPRRWWRWWRWWRM